MEDTSESKGYTPPFLSEDVQTHSAMPEHGALQEHSAETASTMERFSSTSLVALPTMKIHSPPELTQCCSVSESGVNTSLKEIFVPAQALTF